MNPSKIITIEPHRLSTAEHALRTWAEFSLPTISWDGKPDRRRQADEVRKRAELVALLLATYPHLRTVEAEAIVDAIVARLRVA